MSLDLPTPSAAAQAVSDALHARVRNAIEAAGGALTFDRYMRMALYEPGLGYYSAGARKFGAAGDFVTAPEISPLFGRCLARQVKQVLDAVPGGDVIEFGAGSGVLAVDLLAALQALDCLPKRYRVVEVSADLRERQRQRMSEQLPTLTSRVEWLDSLPDAPVAGVVIANELLDAMPVHRLRKMAVGEWGELAVGLAGDALAWRELPLPAGHPLVGQMQAIEQQVGALPVGYTIEVSSEFGPWLRSVAAWLRCGAMILIDYGEPRAGIFRPERRDGTLLCHYRHRVHDDPLRLVGLQDITASVDFTAVAEAAQDAGFEVAGYCTQAQWLLSLGITDPTAHDGAGDVERLQRAQQIKRLILPGEMGERFKVMMLLTGMTIPSLQGFMLGNELHRL